MLPGAHGSHATVYLYSCTALDILGSDALAVAYDQPGVHTGHVEINWPFPETSCSPVWRAARERETLERERREREHKETAPRDVQGRPEAGPAATDPSPRAAEPLAVLLGTSTAQRLQGVGLHTLGDLAEAQIRGDRWWVFAPGIGEVRARKIVLQVSQALASVDAATSTAEVDAEVDAAKQVGDRSPTSPAKGKDGA